MFDDHFLVKTQSQHFNPPPPFPQFPSKPPNSFFHSSKMYISHRRFSFPSEHILPPPSPSSPHPPHSRPTITLSPKISPKMTTPILASNADVRLIQVQRSQCHFKVYVQGNGDSWEGKTIFLTVHDVGSTAQSIIDFVNHSSMAAVKRHSVFLHVCVPGQDEGEPDLLGDFPSMDQLGENLIHVLDALDVKCCIGIGEGAGADILCRFAMTWQNRVLGLVLIHCLATPQGIIETFKEYVANLRLEEGQMNSADWDYLYAHKFGLHSKPLKAAYIDELSSIMNLHNLSRYLFNFSRRSDISERIRDKMTNTHILLVTGGRTPHIENVHHMHENMRRDKSTLFVIDDVLDVLVEAPTRLSRALILFCKGLGELSIVQIPGLEMVKTPSGSMEEADRPWGRFSPASSPNKMESSNGAKREEMVENMRFSYEVKQVKGQ